jgi:hypothetical protein
MRISLYVLILHHRCKYIRLEDFSLGWIVISEITGMDKNLFTFLPDNRYGPGCLAGPDIITPSVVRGRVVLAHGVRGPAVYYSIVHSEEHDLNV